MDFLTQQNKRGAGDGEAARGARRHDHRRGQACRRDRRRRHRLGLHRHLDPPGRGLDHPARNPAEAAGAREQGADLARLAAEAAHLVLAGGRLRARLGGADQARHRARTAGSRRSNACASSGSRAPTAACTMREVAGQRVHAEGRSGAAGDGFPRAAAAGHARAGRRRRSIRAATSRPTRSTTAPRSPRCSPPATCGAASRWWSGRSAKAANAPAPSTNS